MSNKPFLKWLGSKHRIMAFLNDCLPPAGRLIDPFVGGGSILVGTQYNKYLLSDINPDLINLYNILKNEGLPFINYCQSFFKPANNKEKKYYAYRRQFNQTTDPRLRSALFVYLNRHCFNGLCRYNQSGGFNVPFGKYERPYFPYKQLVNFHHKSQLARFNHCDFSQAIKQATAGDLVYCDPPYDPLSESANFTAYAGGTFCQVDQKRLATIAAGLVDRGVMVAISNHDTPFTRHLYRSADDIRAIKVPRSVSAKASSRTKAPEIVALFGFSHPQLRLLEA